jgi:hypothetical protein
MVVSQMKKTSPSFTFEVKRSKLSPQQPSKFQRFVLEPKQKLSLRRREAMDQGSSDAGKTEAPAVERRILESLSIAPTMPASGEPAEPQVEVRAYQEAAAPKIKRRRKAAAAPAAIAVGAEEPPLTEESTTAAEAAVVIPFKASKSKRKAALSIDHLPRGERWKRRLPRFAW